MGKYQIQGTVAPGFESVRDLYEKNMNSLYERSTQLCIYHEGEMVVDLWASKEDSFSPNALINIFSSGKSFESIALAWLADKGLLDFSKKIADYWPEFAKEGKGELTVADLMRHEAGLSYFNQSLPVADILTENIKKNKVGEVIENHPLVYRPQSPSKREYHAITRGWVANEVFRRIDPEGRTIGEFLRVISNQLGIEVVVGVKENDLNRREAVHEVSLLRLFLESLRPKFLGRKFELNVFQLVSRLMKFIPVMRVALSQDAPPAIEGMKSAAFVNKREAAMGEVPSAGTHSNARSLAKIASAMALKGTQGDQSVFSAEAWEKMHDGPTDATMIMTNSRFTQGGVCEFYDCAPNADEFEKELNDGRQGFIGWMGYGGSIFQWNPEMKIGFGYVPTSLYAFDAVNARGKAYQAEVMKCVERLKVSGAEQAQAAE